MSNKNRPATLVNQQSLLHGFGVVGAFSKNKETRGTTTWHVEYDPTILEQGLDKFKTWLGEKKSAVQLSRKDAAVGDIRNTIRASSPVRRQFKTVERVVQFFNSGVMPQRIRRVEVKDFQLPEGKTTPEDQRERCVFCQMSPGPSLSEYQHAHVERIKWILERRFREKNRLYEELLPPWYGSSEFIKELRVRLSMMGFETASIDAGECADLRELWSAIANCPCFLPTQFEDPVQSIKNRISELRSQGTPLVILVNNIDWLICRLFASSFDADAATKITALRTRFSNLECSVIRIGTYSLKSLSQICSSSKGDLSCVSEVTHSFERIPLDAWQNFVQIEAARRFPAKPIDRLVAYISKHSSQIPQVFLEGLEVLEEYLYEASSHFEKAELHFKSLNGKQQALLRQFFSLTADHREKELAVASDFPTGVIDALESAITYRIGQIHEKLFQQITGRMPTRLLDVFSSGAPESSGTCATVLKESGLIVDSDVRFAVPLWKTFLEDKT